MMLQGFIDKEAGANSERRCDGGAINTAHFAKHNTNLHLIQVRQRCRYVKRCRLAIIVSSYVTLELGMSMGQLIIVMNVLKRTTSIHRGYHTILQILYGILMLTTR